MAKGELCRTYKWTKVQIREVLESIAEEVYVAVKGRLRRVDRRRSTEHWHVFR